MVPEVMRTPAITPTYQRVSFARSERGCQRLMFDLTSSVWPFRAGRRIAVGAAYFRAEGGPT